MELKLLDATNNKLTTLPSSLTNLKQRTVDNEVTITANPNFNREEIPTKRPLMLPLTQRQSIAIAEATKRPLDLAEGVQLIVAFTSYIPEG